MLENLDFDDLEAIADSLPGPHAWTHGTADIFYCQACHISFEFGAEPVPDGPCEQLDLPEGGVLIDGIDLDEFIRRYGRTEAERRVSDKRDSGNSRLCRADETAAFNRKGVDL
jgi:hypothetical protein